MSEAAPVSAATPGEPGLQLKIEREKRGMSLQKAADELHLDAWVIEALEAGDYRRVGPTVYVKGHLKRYAGLLGLPAATIMAAYEAQALAPSTVTLAPTDRRIAALSEAPQLSNLSPSRVLGGLVVALVVIGVVWWKPWHQRGPAPTSGAPAAVLPESAASTGAESAAASMPSPDIPVAATASSVAATSTAGTSTAAMNNAAITAAGAAGAGRARLRLSFSADSWVDVHDAFGKRTFAGNGLANSVKTIAGVAPMRVYLGAGSGVQLEINDRVVAIGPQFFAGDVARFEAGADGVLRRDQAHAAATSTAQTRDARPPG